MTRHVYAGSTINRLEHWDIFGHVIAEAPYAGTRSREYVWLGDMPLAVFDGTASQERKDTSMSITSTARSR